MIRLILARVAASAGAHRLSAWLIYHHHLADIRRRIDRSLL